METKICSKCNNEKNIDRFYLYKKTNKYRTVCKDCQNLLDYEWKRKNKDKVLLTKKKYKEKNKEKIRSETKKRNTDWYIKNKFKVAEERHELKYRFRRYFYNSKNKNREFLLSIEEFEEITNKRCYYCNGYNKSESLLIEINSLTYCGIDRIDNTKSYIKENCVPCCNICNRMKLEMNTQEFIEHIRRIMEFYSDIRN